MRPSSSSSKSGVLYFENEGKNKGCWVMSRAGAAAGPVAKTQTAKSGGRCKGHRPLQRHRHLRRQRHCVSLVEVRPARPRLRLQKVLHIIPITNVGSRRGSGRNKPPAIRRRDCNLQRDRLAPVRSAVERHPGTARHGLHRAGRPLHALQLRNGRAHAALRRGAWLQRI